MHSQYVLEGLNFDLGFVLILSVSLSLSLSLSVSVSISLCLSLSLSLSPSFSQERIGGVLVMGGQERNLVLGSLMITVW